VIKKSTMLMWVNLFTHKASRSNFKGVKIVVNLGGVDILGDKTAAMN
jgi:hypothetical protein